MALLGVNLLFRLATLKCQPIDKGSPCSLRRKPQGRKIGSDNRNSGEPARLDRFAVIRFRQRTAWNVPLVVSHRSDRRGKMCEHEVLRSYPVCHGAKIGSPALSIKG